MADDVLERTAGAAGAAAEPAGEIHVARAEASDDGKSLVFLIKSSLPVRAAPAAACLRRCPLQLLTPPPRPGPRPC